MTSAGNPELRLKGMLARIFSDGIVDAKERAELSALRESGELSPAETRAVMLEFLAKTLTYANADGVITERERTRLKAIVTELALPEDCIPDELRRILTT